MALQPTQAPATSTQLILELRQLVHVILSSDDLFNATLKICTFFSTDPIIQSPLLLTATQQTSFLSATQRVSLLSTHLINEDTIDQQFPIAARHLLSEPAQSTEHFPVLAHSSYTVRYNLFGPLDFYFHPQQGCAPYLIHLNALPTYLLFAALTILSGRQPSAITPDLTSPTQLHQWIHDIQSHAVPSPPTTTASTPVLHIRSSSPDNVSTRLSSLSNSVSHPCLYRDLLHAAHLPLRPFIGLSRNSLSPITYTGTYVCGHSQFVPRFSQLSYDTHAIISLDLTTILSSDTLPPTSARLPPTLQHTRSLLASLPMELRAQIFNETVIHSRYHRHKRQSLTQLNLAHRAFTRVRFIPPDSPLHTKSPIYLQLFVHVRHPVPNQNSHVRSQTPYVTHFDTTGTHHIPMFHDVPPLDDSSPYDDMINHSFIKAPPDACHLRYYRSLSWQ